MTIFEKIISMKHMWDERYAQEEFAYGTAPNNFIKEQLSKLKPGKILFPAEGEGRNAVYAASQGWDVCAFDISIEGMKKAEKLASNYNVKIDYFVNTDDNLPYTEEQFDVIAMSYAHFPSNVKELMINTILPYLKKGGYLIIEAFSKGHLAYNAKDPKVGGPKEEAMLYSKDEIIDLCKGFEIDYIEELEVNLNEGLYHIGTGLVLRALLRK